MFATVTCKPKDWADSCQHSIWPAVRPMEIARTRNCTCKLRCML